MTGALPVGGTRRNLLSGHLNRLIRPDTFSSVPVTRYGRYSPQQPGPHGPRAEQPNQGRRGMNMCGILFIYFLSFSARGAATSLQSPVI